MSADEKKTEDPEQPLMDNTPYHNSDGPISSQIYQRMINFTNNSTKASVKKQNEMLDVNRMGNKLAILGLVVFWVWFSLFLILQYIPFQYNNGEPVYVYSDRMSDWADKLCPVDPDGAAYNSYCVWYYPAFFAFTLAALLVRRVSIKPRRSWLPAGDTDFVLLFYVAILAPLLVYYGFYIKKKYSPRDNYDDDAAGQKEYLVDLLGSLANRTGYLALWPLTFFMIPASKHAPILALLDWHPFHAMSIHMWCGRLSFFATYLHFVLYIAKYVVRGVYNGFTPAEFFFPPPVCFAILYDEDPPPKDCAKMLAGFFGFLAILAFTVLYLSSLKVVRRHRYMLFYISHILCAPLLLVFLVLHYNKASFYIWPSLFYYAAANTPVVVQHWRNTINRYGLKVTKVMDIPCREAVTECDDPKPKKRSLLQRIFFVETVDWIEEQIHKRGPTAKSVEHCISFDFECTTEAIQQFRPGIYGNVFVPDISIKSHPFTVMHAPGKENELRIVFRVFGKFTDLLARSLLRLVEPTYDQEHLPIPKLMMDGWHGSNNLVEHAMNHEKVVLVAAGIGITAHMTLFCELVELLCLQNDGLFVKQCDIKGRNPVQTKEVTLHWMCRDENLIRFITDEYFGPLLSRASSTHSSEQEICLKNRPVRCRIVIHRTGALQTRTIHESSLWKSFIEKDIEGPSVVDHTVLGTYGVAWLPSRFTFGRHETFLGSVPSIIMFLAIFWISYWFSFTVSVWIGANPFDFSGVVKNLSYGWIFVPTLVVAFVFAYIGHTLLDWRDNVVSSKKNKQRRLDGAAEWNAKFNQLEIVVKGNKNHTMNSSTDSTISNEELNLYQWAAEQHKVKKTLDLTRRMKLESLEIDWDNESPITVEDPEKNLPDKPIPSELGSKFLTLASKGGRPSGQDIVFDCAADCEQFDPKSTGIFLCGPEAMISSVKKATGMDCCMVAAGKMKNFVKKKKFAFYEEKFEW